MTMPRRRFGRTELEVPVITFGGGWVGGLLIRADKAVREAALDRALAAGIDWIDTAALYGKGVSETVIGEWLAGLVPDRRPRISTKFNVELAGGDPAGSIVRSVEASFRRLGVDKVPLLFLHNPIINDDNPDDGERSLRISDVLRSGGAADVMEELRSQGLCDWLGFNALGDPAAQHVVVESGRFDAVQVYYNMLNPSAAAAAGPGWNSTDFGGLLQRCADQDMGVMGIRIFAGGHLAATERHGREIPITDNTENAAEEARAAAVFALLKEDHGSRAQTALRFGLACPHLSTIVVGLGEPEHLEQAVAAVEMGPLPEETLAALEGLRAKDPAFRS